MVRRCLMEDRKGYIGALNLSVISITIAIAMAGWIYGVSAGFVRSGRVEISGIYVTRNGNEFIVSIAVKNVGGSETTIERVYLNKEVCSSDQLPLVLKTGQDEVLRLRVPIGKGIESGLVVQVTLHMVEGLSCSTLAILP